MPAGLGAAPLVAGPLDREGHFLSASGLGGRNAPDTPPMPQLPKGSCPALELISQLLGMGTIQASQPVPGDPGQWWVAGAFGPLRKASLLYFAPVPLAPKAPTRYLSVTGTAARSALLFPEVHTSKDLGLLCI